MGCMKNIKSIHRQGEGHWVGDGFPVHTVFHYDERPELSPFILLDHAGPAQFKPGIKPRGVEWHPHRGFETVTVVYDGEVVHQDTAGNGGSIGPGEVQWMTAGSGLLHKEMHSDAFTRRGGRFEVLQLWVNLPATSKMTAPRYQTLWVKDIPVVALAEGAGTARVIAGEFEGVLGPAKTFSPMTVLDLRLAAGGSTRLDLVEGHTAALYVLNGKVLINGAEVASGTELVIFEREGGHVDIEAGDKDATLFVMHGQPIDEPVVGHGPFVMNTSREIRQAFVDFHYGKMGKVPEDEAVPG
jgi:redox-sensitive bicupin YhaK (pirin superfamily)